MIHLDYNGHEVIPMNRVDRAIKEVRRLHDDELKDFHEKYLEFLEQVGLETIQVWGEDDDDYSDLLQR